MNTKHTPGPWQIGKSSAGKGGTSLSIWRNDEGPNPPEEARNTNYVRIAQHVHCEADARLIATAPELYRDHTEMLPFIRGYAESADADDPVHEMLKRYEATNAKVTS